jgi:hypothetical protein
MTDRKTAVPGRLGWTAPNLVVLLISACGSSAHSTASSTAVTASTCEHISAVLGDGPDPDADPVGYAEAQILPLRQISVPDQPLRGVIGQLADAYQEFFTSNGSSNAKEAVAVASKKLNSICPGAAS